MYLDSDVSVAFDTSIIECYLEGIMVIYDRCLPYFYGMIQVIMVF